MEGAQLQRGCVIGPNSFVPAGSRIPANTLWVGNPVQYVRHLENSEEEGQLKEGKERILLS